MKLRQARKILKNLEGLLFLGHEPNLERFHSILKKCPKAARVVNHFSLSGRERNRWDNENGAKFIKEFKANMKQALINHKAENKIQ